MPSIKYGGKHYRQQKGESVLATLLRQNVDIPYSCEVGACHTCLMRRTDGEVPESAQPGLKSTLKQQHYFLACQFIPDEDIQVAHADDEDVSSHATVTSIDYLGEDICRVRLDPATPLYYHAGQYINLKRNDDLIRSYSLASVPRLDQQLELHVKLMDNGQMSNWIYNELRVGDHVDIQGPYGDCFYVQDNAEQDLLFVGTGTGLAPLMGIARDALDNNHSGNIYLYHGSRNLPGLYMHNELKQLAEANNRFHYIPCLSGDGQITSVRHQRANEAAFADFTDLKDMKIYLCGHPEMVKQAKMSAYLNGADIGNIFVDAFEMKNLRQQPRD
ncbi:MAG: FAD-binding oxidoreductase [Thioalkalispiraceae bacterium]|jgi:NAD(P)H-flavin reductase/ferredoxin